MSTEISINDALKHGVEAHRSGKVEEADRYYTAILQAQPNHPDANHNMGVLAVGLGKVEEALPFFTKALEANKSIEQFWLSYIDALIRLDRMEEAQVVLDQAKEAEVKGDGFDKLEQRLGTGKSDERKRKVQDPPQSQLQPVLALYKNGDLEQVLNEAGKLLKKFPNSVILHNLIGAANAGLKRLDAAIEAYKNAIILRSNYAPAYNNLGSALREQGNLGESLNALEKALEIKPNYTDALNNIGITFLFQDKLEEATNAFKRVLKIAPKDISAINNLGNAFKQSGKLKDAVEIYNKALGINPNSVQTYNNLGLVLQELGELQEALERYSEAIRLNPNYAEAHNNKGTALQELGRYDEAVKAYNKAMESEDHFKKASYNLAILLYEKQQYEEAAKLFAKDLSTTSQTYLLKCFFEEGMKSKIFSQIDYLLKQGDTDAVLGAYISRSKIKFGMNIENPFCNEPLNYVSKINLSEKCDFSNIFIKNIMDILKRNKLESRSQALLTNGIQTVGNVFDQINAGKEQILDVIYKEVENYRLSFKKSNEGFLKCWPIQYELDGWLVSMKSGGALAPHIHERGWISGSIYINVPKNLNDESGNLVVCIDNEIDDEKKDITSRSINVVTGSLCLFPSSLFHYTIPFEADENRIVLAFDLIPK